jgi:hypothetical protein
MLPVLKVGGPAGVCVAPLKSILIQAIAVLCNPSGFHAGTLARGDGKFNAVPSIGFGAV